MAGQWKTWADVPAKYKRGNAGLLEPTWTNQTDFYVNSPYVGRGGDGEEDSQLRAGYKAEADTLNDGNPLAYGEGGTGLFRHPDGSFSEKPRDNDSGFLTGLAIMASAFGGGALVGEGAAAGAGMGATVNNPSAWMSGLAPGGAGGAMTASELAAYTAAGAGGGSGLSALTPASVGSPGTVAGVSAGGGGLSAVTPAAGAAPTTGLLAPSTAAASSLIPGITNSTLAQLAASAVGAVVGGQDSTTESKKEPWGPAQPYILENLQDTKKLKDFYQQNPFNQQQKTSYQNLFGDLDNFRQNTAPGLMDFANRSMTNTYQRQRGGNVGDGAGYGGPVQRGGLLQSGQGPFSVNPGQQYGLIDFNAMNPFAQQPQQTQQPQQPQQGLLAQPPTGNEYQGGSNWRDTKQYAVNQYGESVPGSRPLG